MTTAPIHPESAQHRRGLMFVFAAGVLWSTVGLGIRLIEDATVWQILFYRSISLTILLYIVIRWRTGRILSPWSAGRAGWLIAALSLVFAYSRNFLYADNLVANAMLLFATAPFMAAVLGWVVLRERVRDATWIAVLIAICGIAVMVSDQTGAGTVLGSLAALGSALGLPASPSRCAPVSRWKCSPRCSSACSRC